MDLKQNKTNALKLLVLADLHDVYYWNWQSFLITIDKNL